MEQPYPSEENSSSALMSCNNETNIIEEKYIIIELKIQ